MTNALPGGLVEALHAAQRVMVLTGAGVSAASGLPTFRDGTTGLWAQYRPEDLATADAFRRDPKLVWDWYAWRREMAARAAPNPAHFALADMARRVPEFALVTQNVDGLHQSAGSTGVVELHGSIHRVKCFEEGVVVEDWGETQDGPPHCPRCDGLLRPDVVWFGENLPSVALEAAVRAAETCDLFLSVGTSGVVEPAASLARIASQNGATVGVINLDVAVQNTPRRYQINGLAAEVLPALLEAAWPGPISSSVSGR